MNGNFMTGLALGSGAARGLAHMGVIETLKKNNIPVDMVSGCSAGALIGAMYCCQLDFKYIKMLCKSLNQRDYIDISVPRTGLIRGNKIVELLKLVTKNCDFKDLKIPLVIVATDLKNKELKIFSEGKVYEAVRASISVPGVFVPYFKDDMTLVDGAVLERVPAKVLRDKGMDFVIGVDVGYNMTSSSCKSIFHVLFEVMDLMSNELFTLKKQDADIMIRVDLNDIDPTRFDQVDLCVERGIAAAEKAIPDIHRLLEEKMNYKASLKDKCDNIV